MRLFERFSVKNLNGFTLLHNEIVLFIIHLLINNWLLILV